MRTYTITITKTLDLPILKICRDRAAENPRKTDKNIGYFISILMYERTHDTNEEIEKAMQEVRKYASNSSSFKDHAEVIKKEYEKNTGDKVLQIFPISKYDDNGLRYRVKEFNEIHRFDSDIVAFYIVTQKTAGKSEIDIKEFKEIITKELEKYSNFINRKVYEYTLRDENGEIIESRSGLYGIEEVRKCLPKDWKNEYLEDYIIE